MKLKPFVTIDSVVTAVCAIITFASIAVRVHMLFVPRSLWIDEAMLADNIVTRSFTLLVSTPLLNLQTAPVLYLYAVKFFAAVFHYSEGGLRLYSFFALIGVLVLLYFLLSNVFKVSRVLTALGVTLIAILRPYMFYSNETKPYMGEVFFILAVLSLYFLYRNKKIKLMPMTLLFMVFLLFSNSVLFFIASVFMVEFFGKLIKKERDIWKITLAGCGVLVFFLLYYSWWLKPVAKNEIMVNSIIGEFLQFPDIRGDTIKHNIALIKRFLEDPRRFIRIAELCVLGFIVSLLEKNRTTFVTAVAGILVAMASLLKKIPLTDRLNLYIYVLIIVYIIVFLENIQIGKTVFFSKLVPVLTGCFLIAGNILSKNMNFINFINDSSGGSEVNPLIKHVEKTIAADEYFYSYIRANFVVRYKTGYTNRIGNTSSQNIIYGQNSFDWMGVEFDRAAVPDVPWDIQWDYGKDGVYPNEITRVVDAGKCWILFAQTNSPDFEQMTRYGLDKLREQGTVTQVMNVHDTYLYYFQAHE